MTTMQALAFDLHAAHHTLPRRPERRIRLAADGVEERNHVVAQPDRIQGLVRELDRLQALDPKVIQPAHGDPEVIAAGGHRVGVIEGTRDYLWRRCWPATGNGD